MQPVESVDVEGVDYGWVMQTTFVVTIIVGAPVVAVLSSFVTLDTWGARAGFAIRVGAPIWFVTAIAVALYAKRIEGDGDTEPPEGSEHPDDTEPGDVIPTVEDTGSDGRTVEDTGSDGRTVEDTGHDTTNDSLG